ncbi:MAG: hypothetical protein AB2421_11815 [Thermotaleaceae bacterium]
MSHTYVEDLNFSSILVRDKAQDIYLATSKANPEETVLVNILRDKGFLSSNSKKNLRKSLQNLLHLEETNEGLVLITKSAKGIPLSQYLHQDTIDIDTQIYMLFQYLKGISRYTSLSNNLVHGLIDELQVFVNKGLLEFSELILSTPALQSTIDFKSIVEKVTALSKRIFSYDTLDSHLKTPFVRKIIQFIDDLEKGLLPLNSLADLFHAYKDIYFSRRPSRTRNSSRSSIARSGPINEGSHGLISKIVLGFLLVGIGIYGSIQLHVPQRFSGLLIQAPVANFEKIDTDNGWEFVNNSTLHGKNNSLRASIWEIYKSDKLIEERKTENLTLDKIEPGNYKVRLTVEDAYNKTSLPFEREFTMDVYETVVPMDTVLPIDYDTLDDYDIVYTDTSSTFIDEDIFRTGTYAIRLEKTKSTDHQSIVLSDLSLDKNTTLSMWLMSNSPQPINFQIQGYTSGKLSYNQKFSFNTSNTWSLFTTSDNLGNPEYINIQFFNHNENLWIDDIVLDSYK